MPCGLEHFETVVHLLADNNMTVLSSPLSSLLCSADTCQEIIFLSICNIFLPLSLIALVQASQVPNLLLSCFQASWICNPYLDLYYCLPLSCFQALCVPNSYFSLDFFFGLCFVFRHRGCLIPTSTLYCRRKSWPALQCCRVHVMIPHPT